MTAQQSDWQQEIRAAAQRKEFNRALELVGNRLATNPEDLEARGWRARLLGWSGRLAESEAEYRSLLRLAPDDIDIRIGLADVLSWQGQAEDALDELKQAPDTTEVLLRRARLLARLHRWRESREVYREVLQRVPGNSEAKSSLAAGTPDARHELRFDSGADRFNYTDTASSESVTLISRWNERWTTAVSSIFYQRFGAAADRVTLRVSRRIAGRNWIAVGGGAGHDEEVIPRREAGAEVGRSFQISNRRFLRGIELSHSQQWLWFSNSRVHVLTTTAIFYLPRAWTFTLASGAVRSAFPARGSEWQPTGSARLGIPLHAPRWSAQCSFAVGSENFAKADEIGHFSARTFGGGFQYNFTARQDIGAGIYFQDRSQRRTQTSVAVTYGIRF